MIFAFISSSLLQAQYAFLPRVVSNSLSIAQNLENIDFNGDGLDDILVGGEKLLWFETDSSGQFIEHEIASSPGTTITSRPKDFDNDGDIDFVSSHWTRNAISLWINDGSQNFTEQIILENFIGAHDAVIADMNNDGYNDVLCARGDANNNGEIIYLMNNNDGSFTSTQVFTGDFCHSVDVSDFNGDGLLDITSSHVNEGVRIFLNNYDNSFTEYFYPVLSAHFVRTCDLDNDGDADVLCAALDYSVCLLENTDGTTFNKKYLSYRSALFLDPVDFNRDGHMDVLISDFSTSDIRLLQNKGDNTFSSVIMNGETFGGVSGTCAFDLGGDGDIDFISSNWNRTSEIKVWENLEFTTTGFEHEKEISNEFVLYQNYPNPFNPKSNIKYQIEKSGVVELAVYDLLGRKVSTLVSEYKPAGKYEVNFDGSDLASGTYLYELKTGEQSTLRKMLLVK